MKMIFFRISMERKLCALPPQAYEKKFVKQMSLNGIQRIVVSAPTFFFSFFIFSEMGHTKTLLIFLSSASKNKINSLNISSIQLGIDIRPLLYTYNTFQHTTKSLHLKQHEQQRTKYRIILIFFPLIRSHLSSVHFVGIKSLVTPISFLLPN